MGKVTVVGSLNMDLVVQVDRLPRLGETLAGNHFATFAGGKGNNQAIAAARAGAEVWFVGKVGADSYGDTLTRKLKENGIHTAFVFQDSSIATGTAHIFVTKQGDNSIVVVPGANGQLSVEDLIPARNCIEITEVLLLQMEVPLPVNEKAAEIARNSGTKVIFNCAPAPESPTSLQNILNNTDILVLNEIEAQNLGAQSNHWQNLLKLGVKTVIVTLGADGAVIIEKEVITHIPSYPVTVVDTTGAGDAFCGAFAAHLAQGGSLEQAVRYGCAAGALATTKAGAEPSLPYHNQIMELSKTALF
jgi:ribokinase